MRYKSFISGFIVLAVVTVASCVRRDIYEEGKTPVPVVVQMSWRNLGGDPTGATICFYPEDGTTPFIFKTNSVGNALVEVPSGFYTVMVFNRTVDEFGTMHFAGMEGLGTARAILDGKYYGWVGTADSVGYTVYEPELIVSGRTDHFEVRERANGVIKEHENTREITRADVSYNPLDPNVPDTVKVVPQRMLYEANFNVMVNGIQNVKSVRAYVTGMAGGEYLATRASNELLATHVLENWTVERRAEDYTKGYLKTTFNCFGLPVQYKNNKLPENEYLYLQVRLIDGQTIITKGYNIGDLIMQYDDELEVDLIIGLRTRPGDEPLDLPDVKPEGGSESGFDANLEDWGEYQDVIIPM